MKKDRRNLIIYHINKANITMAFCFTRDDEAKKVYEKLVKEPGISEVEWFGREYDSYELEVSDEDR